MMWTGTHFSVEDVASKFVERAEGRAIFTALTPRLTATIVEVGAILMTSQANTRHAIAVAVTLGRLVLSAAVRVIEQQIEANLAVHCSDGDCRTSRSS